MKPYRIAAIPTVYKGRQYRSRLEARWAAFFDLLGWKAEYEPYDLGRWSPDFLLRGRDGIELLVEVKPITTFDQEVGDKAVAACFEKGLSDSLSGILLVGVGPTIHGRGVIVGWHGTLYSDEPKADWGDSGLGWLLADTHPEIWPDLINPDPSGQGWSGVLTGIWGRGTPHDIRCYQDHTMKLWAEATNRVQWFGKAAPSE